MHSTNGITDRVYSTLDNKEKITRIDSIFGATAKKENLSDEHKEFLKILPGESQGNNNFLEFNYAILIKKLLDLDSNQKPSG